MKTDKGQLEGQIQTTLAGRSTAKQNEPISPIRLTKAEKKDEEMKEKFNKLFD